MWVMSANYGCWRQRLLLLWAVGVNSVALGLLMLPAAAVVVRSPALWLGRETGMLCCHYNVKMATFCA